MRLLRRLASISAGSVKLRCRILRQALRSWMPLEFTTAPDERERCCVGVGERRCRGATRWRFVPCGADEHQQELCVYTCSDCAPSVAEELGPAYEAHASA